jgi:hypothetical protein
LPAWIASWVSNRLKPLIHGELQRSVPVAGVEAQGRQYHVAPDGSFLINSELDSAAEPITLLMNEIPEAKK